MSYPKTVAIDFDGVIHSYEKGWHDGTIYGEPTKGALNFLCELMRRDDVSVFIHTTRNARQVVRWLDEKLGWSSQGMCPYSIRKVPWWTKFWNKTEVIGVTNRKLPAIVYIDDRALEFRGSWEEVKRTLTSHRYQIRL